LPPGSGDDGRARSGTVLILVFDPRAPTSERALAELSKKSTRAQLIAIARWSTRSAADAEDLVSRALLSVLDPDKAPWVSTTHTFLTHMSRVMRHVWDEDMRRARVRHEVADENVTRDFKTASREPPADEELHRRRSLHVLRELGQKLLAEIGSRSPIAKGCYELGAAGIEEAEEQAAILGCSIEDVHQARETLKRQAKRIRQEYDQAEESRMKAVRERAGTIGEDQP
jgi:DNA-directed RNA polymerase specialized sigma24 family protein